MSQGRNLLQEAAHAKAEAEQDLGQVDDSSAAKKLKLMPKAPAHPPPSEVDRAFVESQPAHEESVAPQVLKVIVDDAFADQLVEPKGKGGEKKKKGDDNEQVLLTALTVIQGLYFMLGTSLAGMPVWKQKAAVPPAQVPLMIFWVEDAQEGGWYCADKVFTNRKDPAKDGCTAYMWMGGNASSPILQACHVPYWAKKKCPGVRCCSYMLWLETELTVVQKLLQDQMGMPGSSHDQLGAGQADEVVEQPVDDMMSDGCQKGHKGLVKRAGWMEKCVRLTVPYYLGDWDTLTARVDDLYYNSSKTFKELVQQGVKMGKNWS